MRLDCAQAFRAKREKLTLAQRAVCFRSAKPPDNMDFHFISPCGAKLCEAFRHTESSPGNPGLLALLSKCAAFREALIKSVAVDGERFFVKARFEKRRNTVCTRKGHARIRMAPLSPTAATYFSFFKPQNWRKRSVVRGRGFIQRFPRYRLRCRCRTRRRAAPRPLWSSLRLPRGQTARCTHPGPAPRGSRGC